jgi:putative oxidoreductase
MAFIFVVEGWLKITHYPAIVEYMQSYGVSGRLLPIVIVTELGGGLLVAVGFLTRWAAAALAGFALLTALFFHRDFADPDQIINFYKNMAIAGGFLLLVGFGPGAWSVDALWRPLWRRTTQS